MQSLMLFIYVLVGGLVCATATSSPVLICGRAVSGIGAVGLSIGGFRLLAMLPESKRQNLSLGIFSLFLGIPSSAELKCTTDLVFRL